MGGGMDIDRFQKEYSSDREPKNTEVVHLKKDLDALVQRLLKSNQSKIEYQIEVIDSEISSKNDDLKILFMEKTSLETELLLCAHALSRLNNG